MDHTKTALREQVAQALTYLADALEIKMALPGAFYQIYAERTGPLLRERLKTVIGPLEEDTYQPMVSILFVENLQETERAVGDEYWTRACAVLRAAYESGHNPALTLARIAQEARASVQQRKT